MSSNSTQQVPFLAIEKGAQHFGLLPDKPNEQWRAINEKIYTLWTTEPAQQLRLPRIGGCLDKLTASLLQCHRMRQHHDELVGHFSRFPTALGVCGAYSGNMACADFEGLLLHGRAALDRLTWFVSSEFSNQCSSFRKLPNVLQNFIASRPVAQELISVFDAAKGWIDAVFAKLEADHSLRDLVGHKHAISEGMTACFSVSGIAPKRILAFDCEITLPDSKSPTCVIKTSRDAAKYLSFIILNSLALLMGIETLTLDVYEPNWTNRTISFFDYVVDEPAGSPLGLTSMLIVRRMYPGGCEIARHNVKPEILQHVIELP